MRKQKHKRNDGPTQPQPLLREIRIFAGQELCPLALVALVLFLLALLVAPVPDRQSDRKPYWGIDAAISKHTTGVPN